MTKSKKTFLLVCVCFVAFLAYVSYDISSRTTFPGSKGQLKERLKKKFSASDSAVRDTLLLIRR